MPGLSTALYTTVFPQAARFLPAWLGGVLTQDDPEFTLCVALDGMTPAEVQAAAGQPFEARWLQAAPGATPAEVRRAALAELVDDFEAVVLVDSDDVLLPGRVGAARRCLQEADACCCAMRLVDAEGRDTGAVFDPAPEMGNLDRVNVFGFTNSAYRTEVLRDCLSVPRDCALVDWYVLSAARARGARLACDAQVGMQYRQYPGNIATVLPPFTPEQVLRAARLVLGHYDLLAAQSAQVPDWEALAAARADAECFIRRMEGDAEVLERYVRELNALNVNHVWWSLVAHPALETVWND